MSNVIHFTSEISETNPMGTDGFEFVEYAASDPQELDKLFKSLGFRPVAKHRSKDVTLYRQGIMDCLTHRRRRWSGVSVGRIQSIGYGLARRFNQTALAFGIKRY